ncbi:MAG: terminase, partial [Oscillospiraceae bacterium]
MAKDGTNRGGRRVRAGDKPAALADKITNGKAATVLQAPLPNANILEAPDLVADGDLHGEDMPSPSEYLS